MLPCIKGKSIFRRADARQPKQSRLHSVRLSVYLSPGLKSTSQTRGPLAAFLYLKTDPKPAEAPSIASNGRQPKLHPPSSKESLSSLDIDGQPDIKPESWK